MRTRYIRAAGLLLATAGLWLGLTQQGLTITKIADDLHVIVGSGGNVAVFVTDEGTVLVDDKFERNVPEILEKVKSLTDKQVRYVLNTHQHGDHTGGNARLMLAGVEAIAHENAAANMETGKMPGLPRLAFADKFTVRLGGKIVRAQHFGRGHTNGDAFMLFPERRVLHTGDMFVAGAPLIDYASGGSGIEWTKTIDAVLALPFDTVIPGHGPVMKREQLLEWKQSFEKLKSDLKQMRQQQKSQQDAVASLKFENYRGLMVTGSWGRSLPGLWDELGR